MLSRGKQPDPLPQRATRNTTPETDTSASVSMSEVLSALSYALDMVEGQAPGHVVRSCLIGMRVGARLGLGEQDRSALFYALLLKDAGCSANAARVSALFGADDFHAKHNMKTVNWSSLPCAALYVARNVSPDGAIWTKARHLVSLGAQGQQAARQLVRLRCERGGEIAQLLEFGDDTAAAIRALDEHWDGAGHPDGLAGEQIPLLARICGLAQTVEVFHTHFGVAQAEAIARKRRGTWFDPALVDLLLAEARSGALWRELADPVLEARLAELEPQDRVLRATPQRLDLIARAFAQIIDAKSPFTYRHSEGVADVAARVATHLGLSEDAVHDQRRAGWLHDVGKLGVSNRILDKPDRLTPSEMAAVRRHPELTHRTLTRVASFAGLAQCAAAHHERLDGSGYFRGVAGSELDLSARILATADVFDALAQERPYRAALPLEQVLAILRSEAPAKLDPACVLAVEELALTGQLTAAPSARLLPTAAGTGLPAVAAD